MSRAKTNEEFVQELALVNPDIEPIEPYPGNNKTPVLCKCKQCHAEWRASSNNLLSKHHHCPYCSRIQRGKGRRKNDDDFKRELSKINNSIIPLDPYVTSQNIIRCLCKNCGHVWLVRPNSLLSKRSRCPECCKASTSIVEQILLRSFSSALDQPVLSRDKKAIGKELDIYIPHIGLAIEYGAWYWHKNKLKQDNDKQKLCKEKDIHLITIIEDCPFQSSNKLVGDYRLYTNRINDETDYQTLKKIIFSICSEYNLNYEKIRICWDTIVSDSISFARKRSNEDFVKMVNEKNPSLIVCEPYTKSNIKILCKCTVCGHRWKAIPTTIVQGIGCPKCARTVTGLKLRYTNDEFLSLLAQSNPNIEPLDPYETSNKPIRCKCKECGNIWMVKPSNIIHHNGCPQCGKEKSVAKQSKPIRCVETGIVYKSLAEATRQTGIFGLNKCAKGYQKTAGGYHWEYVE